MRKLENVAVNLTPHGCQIPDLAFFFVLGLDLTEVGADVAVPGESPASLPASSS